MLSPIHAYILYFPFLGTHPIYLVSQLLTIVFEQVLVYEYNGQKMVVRARLIGNQFGSYFGSSILTADIDGDLVSDLLVGAPTKFLASWDEGCVFVYRNDGKVLIV